MKKQNTTPQTFTNHAGEVISFTPFLSWNGRRNVWRIARNVNGELDQVYEIGEFPTEQIAAQACEIITINLID